MLSKDINLLDLFAGIGGFAKGLQDGGFNIIEHFYSEIEPHAIANYQFNFKNSKYAGPVESISGTSLPQVDIITFGSPCQDFSIAGQRAGLDGERSSLLLQAVRIITEKRPAVFVWENVKGAFSSNNSEDFWAILQAFANIGGYNIEWQCVNTLWLLPQNRERIYLVGHLAGPERGFIPIFPITKNDRLFREQENAKKRQSQAQHSGTINGKSDRASCTFVKIPETAGTLTGGGNSGGLHSDMTIINAEYFSHHQQDRIYNIDGAIGCLSKNRTDDKAKIKVTNTQPRTGDPKKGGTGLLEKYDETYCLDTNNSTAIQQIDEQYRRLTEIECERLQGFPDDWTKFGIYKGKIKEIKQTNRYKLIGNAVTKLFPEIIAKRLIENYQL